MKKLCSFVLVLALVASVFALGGKDSTPALSGKTVTVTGLDGKLAATQVEVPFNPQRVAILDMAALDILDALNLGDRIVGMAGTTLPYLNAYSSNKNLANLGTIKEANLEAVMASEPDVIFIGSRLSASYDVLSQIAPVVQLAVDRNLGVVESVRQNATTIASIFGKEAEIESLMADFDQRIAALADFAKDKNGVIGLCTSGGFNLLGNDGRCSIIGTEIGFTNIGASDVTSTHGNEGSFELLVQLNPQYLFVLDRDAAIQTQGAKLAQEIIENQLVMKTDAYKNGNIVYLDNPAVWYTAEGGITALDIMLQDLEGALLK